MKNKKEIAEEILEEVSGLPCNVRIPVVKIVSSLLLEIYKQTESMVKFDGTAGQIPAMIYDVQCMFLELSCRKLNEDDVT
jgi:hypothetical protein